MKTPAPIHDPVRCPQCGTPLNTPEWSENVNEREAIHIWRCIACGHEFETTDNAVEQEPCDTEIVEELLPSLLVA